MWIFLIVVVLLAFTAFCLNKIVFKTDFAKNLTFGILAFLSIMIVLYIVGVLPGASLEGNPFHKG